MLMYFSQCRPEDVRVPEHHRLPVLSTYTRSVRLRGRLPWRHCQQIEIERALR